MTQRLVEKDPSTVRDRVGAILGSVRLTERGVAVATPATDAEAAAVMRVALEEGWLVLPQGSGIGPRAFGDGRVQGGGLHRARIPDLILSSAGMTELVDHEPGDLNVAVRAGVTLGDIQSAVSGDGQWLALDPPGGDDVTLGGVVSTGIAGPLRAQYGRPRDQVLGLTVVDGRARVLRLGGRVVKNVAGFDLVRLAAGSCGALGMITQINFRLYPRAEVDRTLVWTRANLRSAWELGRDLTMLPIPLTAAELLVGAWPAPLGDGGARVLLRLAGAEMASQRMVDLATGKGGAPDLELIGESSAAAARALSQADGAGALAFRLHALPSRGGAVLSHLSEFPFERLALHLLGGTFRGTLTAADGLADLESLAETVEALGGSLSVTRGAAGIATGALKGESASDPKTRLRAEILREFDPSRVLPGAWREGWLDPPRG